MSIIEFRDVRPEDIGMFYALQKKYEHTLAEDDNPVLDPSDDAYSFETLQAEYTVAIIAPQSQGEEPVGFVNFTDVNRDLSAQLHFIINPAYFWPLLREKVFLDILLDRFKTIKVQSFILITFGFNKASQWMASRMGFAKKGQLSKQVYYGGKPYDAIFYQMDRTDLARLMREQFLKENEPKPVLVEAPKRRKYVKQKKEKLKPQIPKHETIEPVWHPDEHEGGDCVQTELLSGPAGHSEQQPEERSGVNHWAIAGSD